MEDRSCEGRMEGQDCESKVVASDEMRKVHRTGTTYQIDVKLKM